MKKANLISIPIKLLLVIALLVGFNWVYTQYFWVDDLKKYDAHVLLDLWSKQDTCDVIYLGESSNFSIHPNDTQRYSISTLIGIESGYRVGSLNKGAYHAGIYIPLIQRIESETVHTVIVTLNLRTLNQATIHAPIETSLQKQARLFKLNPPLLNRVLLTLNAYDDKDVTERDKAMWYEWTYDTLKSQEVEFPAPTIKKWCELPKFVDENGEQDMEKRTLADHYIKAYAFQIDSNENPRMQELDEITRICKEKGYRLIFNFLAENTEYADSLVGEPLVWLMRQNRDILVQYLESRGAEVVDNLEAVPGKHYTDQNWTTEHYDEVGRQIIANRVADVLASGEE
ncbi:hypothetical protein GYB22_10780 [bacterium]|nr:hypothetical protein [bacterium]